MLILLLCQTTLGVAALVTCVLAARSVLRHDGRASSYMTLTGVLSFIFFITVPDVRIEVISLSLIIAGAGALMMPAEAQRSFKDLISGDGLDVGESTLRRR
jgi:hypothetical protein